MTETKDLIEEDVESKNSNILILHNDEINSFEHIIDSIMGVLGYTEPRAEQLALMAHTNGKTALKEGEMSVLEELHDSFGILNVTTEIN